MIALASQRHGACLSLERQRHRRSHSSRSGTRVGTDLGIPVERPVAALRRAVQGRQRARVGQVVPVPALTRGLVLTGLLALVACGELERELVVGVALYQVISPPAVDLGEVTVARDGSFSADLTVPATTPAGIAEVYLTSDTLDLSGGTHRHVITEAWTSAAPA